MIHAALATFRHGVHPPELKDLTARTPIRRMPFPAEVILPVRQHAGKPAKVVVEAGARVERGDVLATADGFVSSPVHASATGTVTSIEPWPHPDGSSCPAIRIARHSFRRLQRIYRLSRLPFLSSQVNGFTTSTGLVLIFSPRMFSNTVPYTRSMGTSEWAAMIW